MNSKYGLLPIALSALLSATPALSASPRGQQPTKPVLANLDTTEAAALTFMREEERLARDVYFAMSDRWQLLPFENIALSEQQHMDAVKSSMDKYSLPDPSDPNAVGVFTDGDLQQLYSDLVTRGDLSYLEALKVGALIEEVDIEDLENAIANTDNLDLQMMYGNLLRGSRNHLRAFVAEIERQGGEAYTAQHLDQEVVNAIVDSPMERGGKTTGSKRLGMVGGVPSLDQAMLVAMLDNPVARGGNGNGQGTRKGSGKGSGTGTCQG